MSVHSRRRESLLARAGEGLILIRGTGPSGVNPDFLYLTGLAEPRAALLLAPKGVRIETGAMHPGPDYVRGRIARQILFLPASDPLAAAWGEAGPATLGRVDAAELGVDAVVDAAGFDRLFGGALAQTRLLHVARGWPARLGGVDDADTRLVRQVRNRFFDVELREITGAIHEQRQAKDETEIAAIERAVALTSSAVDGLLDLLRDGMREHELEAELTRRYRSCGATHAFDPIVACGANAVLPHYRDNSGPVERGRLLLIDTGSCLGGYRSDLTRTFPVGGKFTDRQREVYEAVLEAQTEAIRQCHAGALLAEIHETAFRVIERAGFGERFIHGTSHHLGLETHDPGDVHRPLRPGAVITVEPGIYLPDEAIGVRIEDDVLITDAEPRVLSEALVKTVEQIERRMAGSV